jgi:hypothetical protein
MWSEQPVDPHVALVFEPRFEGAELVLPLVSATWLRRPMLVIGIQMDIQSYSWLDEWLSKHFANWPVQ